MPNLLFNSLKADIKEEYKEVLVVLEDPRFTMSQIKEPFYIQSNELFKINDTDFKQAIKDKFGELESNIIYKIEIKGAIDSLQLGKLFLDKKNTKFENRAYTKYNEENVKLSNSENSKITLYVGSSKDDGFITRMRCHFGFGAIRTYAMHLKSWLPELENYKISITAYSVSYPKKPKLNTNLLELVEQALWVKEKPLLGKKSGLL